MKKLLTLMLLLFAVASATWFDASWLYRYKCEYNATNLSAENQTNFPVPCIADTASLVSAGKMNATLGDVRFALDNGTELALELEAGTNNTAATVFWVRVPQIDTSNSSTWFFWMYYNKTGASSVSNASAAFSNNYTSVWHGYNGTDSLGNNLLVASGTVGNTNNASRCMYGYCFNYTNNNGYWTNTSATHPTGANPRTVSMWLWTNGNMVNYMHPYDMGTLSGGNGETTYWKTDASIKYGKYGTYEGQLVASVSADAFKNNLTYFAYRITDATTAAGFMDAAKTTLSPSSTSITSGRINLGGAAEEWGEGGAATIDEARLANVSRSDTWLRAELELRAYLTGSEENNSNINPEIVNITLTPASPYTEDNLNCTFYVRDNNTATLNITANWYKNGVLNQNETLTSQAANATYSFILLAGNTTTGENWSCQGYATDGVGSGTLMSANVTIINDAPSIGSMSLTTPAYKLTTLTCSATISDSRTPSVTGTFKWYDNGALVATNPYTQAANTTFTDTSAPPHTQFHNITCSLNASDGELSVVQNASVNISNNAPVITVSLTPTSPYPTSNMSCVVAASDDDGDTLSGLIMWYINGTSILVNTSWSGAPGSYASYLSGYFNATDNISCSSNASDTFTTVSAFSVNRTVRSGSRPSANFTVHNYTYSDFTDYVEGHFDDYGAYYLAILVYAFSYLMTQKYPQTLILGGVGLVAVFFMSGNPMFLAGGILSTVLGYMYKQVTG